jgi:hypothetical protein
VNNGTIFTQKEADGHKRGADQCRFIPIYIHSLGARQAIRLINRGAHVGVLDSSYCTQELCFFFFFFNFINKKSRLYTHKGHAETDLNSRLELCSMSARVTLVGQKRDPQG